MARVEHNLRLYMCFQKPSMSNVDCFETFKAIRAVVDVHRGSGQVFTRVLSRSGFKRPGR